MAMRVGKITADIADLYAHAINRDQSVEANRTFDAPFAQVEGSPGWYEISDETWAFRGMVAGTYDVEVRQGDYTEPLDEDSTTEGGVLYGFVFDGTTSVDLADVNVVRWNNDTIPVEKFAEDRCSE